MGEKLTGHLRKPHPFPVQGFWRIDCTCGWRGQLTYPEPRRAEAEAALNKQFIAHLPADRRQTYVLVDQRPSRVMSSSDPADASTFELPTGNYIMPEGLPCTVLGWWEDGGEYRARVQGFGLGDPILELPVGEIRTNDGRVFRMA